MAAGSGSSRQLRRYPQCYQRRPPTASRLPLPPESRPESQPDPAREVVQHYRRFAEAEVTTPAPHIRGQLLHRLLDADAFGPSRDLADSPLKPIQSLRRNDALDLWTSRKAESQKLPLLRSRHRTLRLIYLELEFLRDELRNALHH